MLVCIVQVDSAFGTCGYLAVYYAQDLKWLATNISLF